MSLLVLDPEVEDRLIAERRRTGADRYDEVWDGVYVMSPLADNQHQDLAGGIVHICFSCVDRHRKGKSLPGANISDRADDWTKNYRCPDAAVFLKGTSAKNKKTHWLGGPDFAAEITSPGDRTWEKLPFYEAVATRELLIVDRSPWSLTLFRRIDGRLTEVGQCGPDHGTGLRGDVIPVTWSLRRGQLGEVIVEAAHHDGVQHWTLYPEDENLADDAEGGDGEA